jgi:RNA polymerase sigma factor (sigma-70 family)
MNQGPEPSKHEPIAAAEADLDPAVVARAAGGDPRAWAELVHRYKRLVYSIPRSYRFSDDLADDVFQTVFATFVRELPRIHDPKAIPKWLITTTHRACWKASKAARTSTQEHHHDELAADPEPAAAARWERAHALDAALTALGGRCERLLRLMYLTPNKVPYTQIAETIGMPIGSIGPTHTRCLEKLAEFVPRGLWIDPG